MSRENPLADTLSRVFRRDSYLSFATVEHQNKPSGKLGLFSTSFIGIGEFRHYFYFSNPKEDKSLTKGNL
jgi:hypothetical protein